MKTEIAIGLIILASSFLGKAQDADTRVVRGRAFLVQSNLAAAQAEFDAALLTNPTHESALVFRAATRLALLPAGSSSTAFLDRLGIPAEGRDIYGWTALPPIDANGRPIAPAGVSAAEATAFLRDTVLSNVVASGNDLAKITNRNFLIFLRKSETKMADVWVDYADVVMLRAMLHAAEYFIYTTYSWNLDVQLTSLRTLYDQGLLCPEKVLSDNPRLLTFATTNDLFKAQQAFTNAIARYLEASDAIRARPGQEPARLFNLDSDAQESEARFRCTLLSLRDSLDHPVVLCTETNYTIHLANHFSGARTLRSLLPVLRGRTVVAGTLPDPTFGGIVQGLAGSTLDAFMARHVPVASWIFREDLPFPDMFALYFNTVTGRVYTLEFSTDLRDWRELAEFEAHRSTYTYGDWFVGDSASGFYRLRDISEDGVLEGYVLDACSGSPVADAWLSVSLPGPNTTTDASGHFVLRTRSAGWRGSYEVSINASGYQPLQQVEYFDGNKRSGAKYYLIPNSVPAPANDMFANRIVLRGFPVSAAGTICGATMEVGETNRLPSAPFTLSGRSVWWTWTATNSGPVSIMTDNNGAAYPVIAVYTGSSLSNLQLVSYGPGNGVTFNAVAGTNYQILVDIAQTGGDIPPIPPPPAPLGSIHLSIAAPLAVELSSPTEGATYMAPANILLSAAATGGVSPLRLAFYAFGPDANLNVTVTNSAHSFVWSNVPGGDYYINVSAIDARGFGAPTSTWIHVQCPQPANNNFANRAPIIGSPATVFGSNLGATREVNEPVHAGVSASNSVWWSWTSPYNGPVTIRAFGNDSGNAALMAVYTGSSLTSLTLVASNAFFGPKKGSQVSFTAAQNTAYAIAVDGTANRGDDLLLQIRPDAAPTVAISSPTNGSFFIVGAEVPVVVTAGDSDGSVEWIELYSGQDLVGICTSIACGLVLHNLAPGQHRLVAVATDNFGVASISAPVTIFLGP